MKAIKDERFVFEADVSPAEILSTLLETEVRLLRRKALKGANMISGTCHANSHNEVSGTSCSSSSPNSSTYQLNKSKQESSLIVRQLQQIAEFYLRVRNRRFTSS